MTSKPETRAAILSGNTFMEAVVKPIARQHQAVHIYIQPELVMFCRSVRNSLR